MADEIVIMGVGMMTARSAYLAVTASLLANVWLVTLSTTSRRIKKARLNGVYLLVYPSMSFCIYFPRVVTIVALHLIMEKWE